jgi:hypothetical protein
MWVVIPMFAVAAVQASGAADSHPAMRNVGEHKTAHGRKECAVSLSIEQIAERATGTLTQSEKDSSIVYLDSKEMKAGASVEVDRKKIEVPWDAFMAFVDLEPQANWGHKCRYLLVNGCTGEVKSFEASFPPFLRGPSKTLRTIWKGHRVPE